MTERKWMLTETSSVGKPRSKGNGKKTVSQEPMKTRTTEEL